MGVVQSIFCSITFCVERVLTWTCCAFLLILLMFTLVLMMVYGISVGYNYAQKELASFAMSSRSTTEEPIIAGRRRSGDMGVVRLLAVNRSQVELGQPPGLEVYQTKPPKEQLYMDIQNTPVILLQTERPPAQPELSPHERELAKKLIGRFRRSKNTTTTESFLRPLRSTTSYLRISTT